MSLEHCVIAVGGQRRQEEAVDHLSSDVRNQEGIEQKYLPS